MAHNIFFNEQKGEHAFFSVQQKAWHGLGQIVSDYPTSAAAIAFAGLDYDVHKRPLATYDNNNPFAEPGKSVATIKVPHHFATIRTDTEAVLGIVGEDYEVVQNRDAFSFFDAIVGGDGMQYETAGALGNGERIFITAKLPGYIRVAGDDIIGKYLFLTTSHDGSGSITAAFTPVRIVCNNTLNAALKTCSHTIRIRHTANAGERLQQAHRLMGISNTMSTQLETIFNHWSSVCIDDREVRQLIKLAMSPRREVLDALQRDAVADFSRRFLASCDDVYAYHMTHPTQQTAATKGTVFGAYNAITGYFQNVKGYRDGEAKLKSVLYGGIAQERGQKAFDLCRSFAAKGSAALFLN